MTPPRKGCCNPGGEAVVSSSGAPWYFSICDRNRRPRIDPCEKALGRIHSSQRDADASVRRRIIGHGGESVDENVSADLNRPWHGRIVVEAGIVVGVFPARRETARRGGAVPSRTDVRFHHEAIAFPSSQHLGGQIDFDAFPTCWHRCAPHPIEPWRRSLRLSSEKKFQR